MRTITYEDSDYNAIDLTGATIRMQVRSNKRSTSKLLDLSTDTSGITITDAVNGVFQISQTATETAAYSFTSGVYDLEIEFSGGEVRRILYGKFTINEEITR